MTWVLRVLVVVGFAAGCAGDGMTDTTDGTPPPTDNTNVGMTDGTGDTGTAPMTTPFDGFSDANLTRADIVRGLSQASAPNLFLFGYGFFAAGGSNSDKNCPSVEENGNVQTYTGGCTDTNGVMWTGAMRVTLNKAQQSANIEFQEFGFSGDEECTKKGSTVPVSNRFDGTMRVDPALSGFGLRVTADITEVDEDACTGTDVDLLVEYEGTMVTVGGDALAKKKKEPEVTVWSGEGRFGHSVLGKADIATYGEITDGACASEAESGVTVLESNDNVAVIIYDGAVDCDGESTVEWVLNGQAQGEIEGVDCSHSGGAAGLGAVLAALLFLRRRRE